MNFCVVEFTGKGEMLVVHSSWISLENKVYCPPYWPNLQKLRKAIERSEAPNKKTWKLYDAKVLHRAGSFDEAHRTLKQAETANTSEIGLEMPLGRGFRRVNASKRISEHETSDEEQQTSKPHKKPKGRTNLFPAKGVIKTPPSFPRSPDTNVPVVLQEALIPASSSVYGREISLGTEECFDDAPNDLSDFNLSAESHEEDPSLNLDITPRQSPSIRNDQMSPFPYDSGIFRHILKKLAVINAKLDDQGDMISTILSSQSKRHVETVEEIEEFDLPYGTASDFQAMEAIIANDKAARFRLTTALGNAGGSNVNDTTYRTLERLMTDSLAMNFSDAVKMNPMAKNPSDFEIEKAIKYWLKRAKSRMSSTDSS